MSDGDAPASDEEPRPSKRSSHVTLMLMAGCGALAYSFARLDPSQREEEVRVYRDLRACLDARVRSAADCRNSYATALRLYPRAVPRYDSFADCEYAHGQGACLIGERVVPDAEKQFVPPMAAFVIGVTAGQDVPPQPAFDSMCLLPGGYWSRDEIRYVAGSGALLDSPYEGSVVTYARSADLHAEPDTLRKAVYGGFVQTGRTCIQPSSGGG